jgi:hypothetical protein
LGRFSQPDTIIPRQHYSQSYDRYAYSFNLPLRFTDPSGHKPCDEEKGCNPLDWGETDILYNYPRKAVSLSNNRYEFPEFIAPEDQPIITFYETGDSIDEETTELPRPSEGPTREEMLELLRMFCGECDPAIPGAFTGLPQDYIAAVQSVLQNLPPGNPYTKYLAPILPIVPPSCTAYNLIYDQITGTGEYSSIDIDIQLTPQQRIIIPIGLVLITLTILPLLPPPP